MKHFLDLGAHKLEGLREFTKKLNIDNQWKVYCYEPNTQIQEETKKNIKQLSNNYKSLEFFNKAVMGNSGKITFNCHKGAWQDKNKIKYFDNYTTGSNALDNNPQFDVVNGRIFDSIQQEVECVGIDDILKTICTKDQNAEIYIKCDIEGSEFVVLPHIIKSNYAKHIVEMYIEWHERMWFSEGKEIMDLKQKERDIYTSSLEKIGIKLFTHH